ncbi:hypothetical protein [Polaribacter septentrionalilitoris]|uniref:hypothetical protein n=1 Tax=Polaribacter septentrionalilitoris TaxID=2494657 RepID=UPI001356F11A|nr:hypothetical protein [Polaribacter septentrionalilitoris]
MKYIQTQSIVERGILTSAYKQEIKHQSQIAKSKSVAQIKSMLFNQSNLESQTGTILRVSVFMMAIILMIS